MFEEAKCPEKFPGDCPGKKLPAEQMLGENNWWSNFPTKIQGLGTNTKALAPRRPAKGRAGCWVGGCWVGSPNLKVGGPVGCCAYAIKFWNFPQL